MIDTVMDESIGIPETFPENASFLPEKCCNYKCFGIHMFIFLHWDNTKKQKKKAKFDIILHKTPKTDWTKSLAPG